MENDNIVEIGINSKEGLYIKPKSLNFSLIYREAMEVHWDTKEKYLYVPKPRKWSYLDWYNQIQKAAKEQSCNLLIANETVWVNIPEVLKLEILEQFHAQNT